MNGREDPSEIAFMIQAVFIFQCVGEYEGSSVGPRVGLVGMQDGRKVGFVGYAEGERDGPLGVRVGDMRRLLSGLVGLIYRMP